MKDSYDAITMDSPLDNYTDGYAPSIEETNPSITLPCIKITNKRESPKTK